jgi:hypothetical protein
MQSWNSFTYFAEEIWTFEIDTLKAEICSLHVQKFIKLAKCSKQWH